MQGENITFWRTPVGVKQFLDETDEAFIKPETWETKVPGGHGPEHRGILINFTEAILDKTPLLAPGTEGLNGVMLANAMLLSAWTDDWVDLPFDDATDDRYEQMLQDKAKKSTFVKNVREAEVKAVTSF